MTLTNKQLEAIRLLWDSTDVFAEDTESEFADTDYQLNLITARNAMGDAFASSHPIYTEPQELEPTK